MDANSSVDCWMQMFHDLVFYFQRIISNLLFIIVLFCVNSSLIMADSMEIEQSLKNAAAGTDGHSDLVLT